MYDDEVVDFRDNDLIETPDYYGKVLWVDEYNIYIQILLIKSDSALMLSQDQKSGKDQFSKKTEYFRNCTLLNVKWNAFLKLYGMLYD